MNGDNFVHLHLHSEYSLLDGAIRIDRLFDRVKELGMNAVAITDHGNMFGVIPFYQEAKKKKIKPIIGCELYLAPTSRFDRTSKEKDLIYHLIVLIEDNPGYKNLIKLVSLAYEEGFYRRPRVDKELLEKYHQGLIALSACLQGEIPSLLLEGNLEKAEKVALWYRDLFGKENFFLELMDHGIEDQKKVNPLLVNLSRKLDIPLVATNDCHYLGEDEAYAHEILLCIQTGAKITDPDRFRFRSNQFYFKSPDQMRTLFSDYPEAIENTAKIAERCNLNIESGKFIMPSYEVPQGETIESYFEKLVRKGFEERIKENHITDPELLKSYQDRLEMEIEEIKKMGYAGYFLIVWDFIDFARRRGIPIGPGRGSAAGSLVSYSLRITNIDPIKYHLYFERFLNPERVTLPDIDIDFCKDRRDEVIKYVYDKYGKDHVAQIITFNTMKARMVIKDVGRAMDIPYKDVDKITKLIQEELNITIDEAIEKEPDLKKLEETDPKVREILKISRLLEGMPRHVSTHAAGIVITREPLREYLPLYFAKKDEITTQYSMGAIETLGLLKIDLLGLRTLTVIHNTLKLVEKTTGKSIDIDRIDINDPETLSLISRGDTVGVFQFESLGMRDLLKRCKITSFTDLIALVALYRPGPMKMLSDFVNRKNGLVKMSYEHPKMKEILEETCGIMIYQEQVIKIANLLAGFSLSQGDKLRWAIGKKKQDIMAELKNSFIQGAVNNGISPFKAEKIYEMIAQFAGYGFNKAHATAYALLAIQTAYLKAHYPVEFMAAVLNSYQDHLENFVPYIYECSQMGIEVLPPDINKGQADFTVHNGKILFGLSAIKNIGTAAIKEILKERDKNGPFTSLFDLCLRVPASVLNKKVLEGLIKSGALDSTGAKRSQMMELLPEFMKSGARIQKEKTNGQLSIFDLVKDNTSSAKSDYSYPDIPEFTIREILKMEKESLGFYITGHPLEIYKNEFQRYVKADTETITRLNEGDITSLGGIIRKISRKVDNKGERIAIISLEDFKGVIRVIIPSEIFNQISEKLSEDLPVLARGRVEIREGKYELMANEVIPFRDIREKETKKIILKLNAIKVEDKFINSLKNALISYPGNAHIIFEVLLPQKNGQKPLKVLLDSPFKVAPVEALEIELEKLVGRDMLIFS